MRLEASMYIYTLHLFVSICMDASMYILDASMSWYIHYIYLYTYAYVYTHMKSERTIAVNPFPPPHQRCKHPSRYIHNMDIYTDIHVHEYPPLQHTATHCNTLQRTATHCNTLQHTAAHCSTLQHTATHRYSCKYKSDYTYI